MLMYLEKHNLKEYIRQIIIGGLGAKTPEAIIFIKLFIIFIANFLKKSYMLHCGAEQATGGA